MSAFYSKGLKELIFWMLKVNASTSPSAQDVLTSDFIKHFLIEESVRHKTNEHALEMAMGQPFDQYERQYEEKRLLGQGGMGKVMLVMRKDSGQYFAAKQQLDSRHFDSAKEELQMLQKLKHPNIVNCVDSFHTPGQDKCVIVLEFCPCKCFLNNNSGV